MKTSTIAVYALAVSFTACVQESAPENTQEVQEELTVACPDECMSNLPDRWEFTCGATGADVCVYEQDAYECVQRVCGGNVWGPSHGAGSSTVDRVAVRGVQVPDDRGFLSACCAATNTIWALCQ